MQKLLQVFFDVYFRDQVCAQEDTLGHIPIQHLELGHIETITHQNELELDGGRFRREEGGQRLAFLIGVPVQLAFLHGVFELEPEVGLIEQFIQLQDQITAVGLT